MGIPHAVDEAAPDVVNPTVRGRLPVLDLLRGIAILGILPANISAFAEPSGPLFSTSSPLREPSSMDRWIDTVKLFLVTGKFRSMLAVLFGIGVWMQFEKRRHVPNAWPLGYLKRTVLLAAIGIAHAVFIWFGDILWIYSGTAAATCLIAHASSKNLVRTIAAGAALAAVASMGAFGGAVWMWNRGMASLPEAWAGASAQPATEIAVYQTGSYGEQLALRASQFLSSTAPAIVLMLPFLLPLFCLGVLWARSGVLAAPHRHARTRNAVLAVGLGGLLLNGLAFALRPLPFNYFATLPWELLFGPVLGIGYLMLGAIWSASGRLEAVRRAIERVGRVALSAYILQSMVCTFVFDSWGLGWFGRMDRLEQLGVVALAWIVDLGFATLWLRFFRLGPLEWLWRSLTEGRRLGMR